MVRSSCASGSSSGAPDQIEIDHVNRLDWTAPLEAINLGGRDPRHSEVVRLLIDAGADGER